MNAQQIAQQIQKLENLAKEMFDKKNSDEEIFEQIYQQIDKLELQRKQALELQQKKLADEAKYLNNEQVEKLYKDNGGTESTVCVSGIEGDAVGLEGVFNNFITNNSLEPQVIFVNQDNHWLTVRLEKTPKEGKITYQVADSMPENPTNNKSNREERIDALLGDICTKIPFKSEKQQNGYDCGIYCALNAVDMKTNLIDEVKYSNAKATYSQYDDAIRGDFENKKVAQPTILLQQKKVRNEAIIQSNNVYETSKAKEKFFETFSNLPKEVRDIILNAAKKMEGWKEYPFKNAAKAYNNYMREQQPSRLSSASTVSSVSNSPKQLNKNSQLQRPLSASSLRSNISMTSHLQKLKRQASEILINKGSSNSRYF